MQINFSKTPIRWNISAFEDIRKMPGIEARIRAEVERVMGYASSSAGYRGGTEDGGDRVRGYVYTHEFEAMLDNARNDTLARGMGGGLG